MVAQCLALCTLTASGPDSIPGLGTKTPQALGHGLKKKEERKIVCNNCLIFGFSILCFVIDYVGFSFQKKLRCDVPVILTLLGNIYLAFIHSSWLTDSWIVGIYWLIRDMADSLFICSLFSVSENTSGPHQRPGVTFCLWGPCLYCMQWHCFFVFLFLFCLRRDSNTWVNVRLHRTLDWPCPGSWWKRGDELSPSLLPGCGNIAGQAGAGEGQDPQGCAAHLQSGWCPAKVKLGQSKNKKQAVLVRTWGKGNPWALLVGMWIVQPVWGQCAGSSKLKIEPQALSIWGL